MRQDPNDHGVIGISSQRKLYPPPALLLEHPAVRDCGVIGRPDPAAGEIPAAFIVLRDGFPQSEQLKTELCGFVADRLTRYKQPREIHFVDAVPRTASGKILRRELRKAFAP